MERSDSGRGGSARGGSSSSPEFEFWMVRNPSCPHPELHTADQLFDNGVLLPLQSLPQPKSSDSDTPPPPEAEPEAETTAAAAGAVDSAVGPSASKRWKDIFKKVEKKSPKGGGGGGEDDAGAREQNFSKANKQRKQQIMRKDRKSCSSSSSATTTAADLNINIWPFSRSRSAGTGTRPKASPAAVRMVSSAPCSRSNSRGESSKPSRKWPASPGRSGLHLGRSSPVWQVRRVGSATKAVSETGKVEAQARTIDHRGGPRDSCSGRRSGSGGGYARVLNLNVPLCIGYRHQMSCQIDDNGRAATLAGPAGGGSSTSSSDAGAQDRNHGGPSLFNLRTFFSKKVY